MDSPFDGGATDDDRYDLTREVLGSVDQPPGDGSLGYYSDHTVEVRIPCAGSSGEDVTGILVSAAVGNGSLPEDVRLALVRVTRAAGETVARRLGCPRDPAGPAQERSLPTPTPDRR